MKKAISLLMLLTLSLFIQSPVFAASSDRQIWFGGEDPVTLQDKHKTAPADFMALFVPDSPWRHAASEVSVFKISMQFASRASDDDLVKVVSDLRRRGIGLGIEMGMLRNDRGCGKGEGYMSKDLLTLAMKRIQKAGGVINDVAMDEVVFFGHEKGWPDQPGQISCRDTLQEVVVEVADNVALIHQYFPNAKIGAVEPITTSHNLDLKRLIKDYLDFADLYQKATGSSLAFFHADIAWRSINWQPGIAVVKAGLMARHIPFGIIIGGDPDNTNDVAWTNAGLEQLKRLSAKPATAPQQIIIQSWQPLPSHYLPETEPGTSTWMLEQAEGLCQTQCTAQ